MRAAEKADDDQPTEEKEGRNEKIQKKWGKKKKKFLLGRKCPPCIDWHISLPCRDIMHPIHRSSSGIQNLIQFSSALIQYLTRAISKNPGKNRKNWSKGKKKSFKNDQKSQKISWNSQKLVNRWKTTFRNDKKIARNP